ncbi:MAG TPA: transposase [Campylobacterales bacterium]|nr:transposase [Campylobacterales bacterium]
MRAMKRLWERKVSDLAFSEFVKVLEYKIVVVKIDRFYPSSKTCSGCGALKEDLDLKTRVYECESCNLVIDRDYNASINIHRVGASTLK